MDCGGGSGARLKGEAGLGVRVQEADAAQRSRRGLGRSLREVEGESDERARLVSQRARERGRGCALRAERGERGRSLGFGAWGTAWLSWAGQEGREEGARWAEHHGPSADRAEEKGGERSGPPGFAGPRGEGKRRWRAGPLRVLGWVLGLVFLSISIFLFQTNSTKSI